MDIERKILAFSRLGEELRSLENTRADNKSQEIKRWDNLIENAYYNNRWFIPAFSREALVNIGKSLTEQKLSKWIGPYINDLNELKQPSLIVGVVNAGNIPAVGFNDFLNVMFSGHKYAGKLSSTDKILLPAIAKKLAEIEPAFESIFIFTEDRLSDFDAVIATGSNNTSRYFDYYFGKYPHIIRRNRNGVAVLTGNESEKDFYLLGKDIFLFFGMGCRNVSKFFIPENYDFKHFFKSIETYSFVGDNNKYRNNYDYNKAIFLVNSEPHLDNGFLLLKKDTSYASPPSVLLYEEYKNPDFVKQKLINDDELVQCIVGSDGFMPGTIPFGKTQQPELLDYADGVDTMKFLLDLSG